MSEERSYPYAVSRVKANESSFVNLTTWNRMYEGSLDDCYHLLSDINYGHEAKDKNNIDELTQASVNSARELINEITPNSGLTNLFLYKVDGHNIKALLKGLIQHEDVESILLPGGTITIDQLNEAFENDNYENFPPIIQKAVDDFDPDQSALQISASIDNSVYKQIISDLREKHNKNDLVEHYFLTKIDLTNILTVLRAYNLGWDRNQTRDLMVPGGNLRVSDLLDALDKNKEQLIEALAQGEFKSEISSSLSNFFETENFFKTEIDFSNIAFNIIHESYTDSFGIGPIINYLLVKEHEAELLRVLFAYKRSNKQISLSELGIK